jgi:hypothetical protein
VGKHAKSNPAKSRRRRKTTTQKSAGAAYKNLAQFIAAYEAWEGDYEYFEVETNADY